MLGTTTGLDGSLDRRSGPKDLKVRGIGFVGCEPAGNVGPNPLESLGSQKKAQMPACRAGGANVARRGADAPRGGKDLRRSNKLVIACGQKKKKRVQQRRKMTKPVPQLPPKPFAPAPISWSSAGPSRSPARAGALVS